MRTIHYTTTTIDYTATTIDYTATTIDYTTTTIDYTATLSNGQTITDALDRNRVPWKAIEAEVGLDGINQIMIEAGQYGDDGQVEKARRYLIRRGYLAR